MATTELDVDRCEIKELSLAPVTLQLGFLP